MKIKAKETKEQVAEVQRELRRVMADHKTWKSRSFLEKKRRLLEKFLEQRARLSARATHKEETKQAALGTSALNALDLASALPAESGSSACQWRSTTESSGEVRLGSHGDGRRRLLNSDTSGVSVETTFFCSLLKQYWGILYNKIFCTK